jgi:hypothetical protein
MTQHLTSRGPITDETIDGVSGATYYKRSCEWCHGAIRVDEPTATITDHASAYRVHRDCGRKWIDAKRNAITYARTETEQLERDIAAYREDPDPGERAMEYVAAIRHLLLGATIEQMIADPRDAVDHINRALSTLQDLTHYTGWEERPPQIPAGMPFPAPGAWRRTETEVDDDDVDPSTWTH